METFDLGPEQLHGFCQKLVSQFEDKTILLLDGPLGAGKTLLVTELVRILGTSSVSSPTYSLINSYPLKNSGELTHVDLYRLEDQEDLESTGFWDLFSQDSGIVCIEWANRLNQEELPLDWKKISLKIQKKISSDNSVFTNCKADYTRVLWSKFEVLKGLLLRSELIGLGMGNSLKLGDHYEDC